jgi:two-component system, LytTR family, sensor kinase
MALVHPRYIVPATHILIWVSLLVIPAIIFNNIPIATGLPPYFFLVTNIYHIGLFYLNAYFLYPVLFTRKTWWLYISVFALILVFSYYIKIFLLKWAFPGFILNSFNNRIIFFPTLAFLVAGIVYRFILDRIQFERLEKERKAERLTSELKFLRSQISPHFLFNMMANMVSLARKKSDMLESSLLKLSDLMRYMLYESDRDRFQISDEINYLKSYVDLQRLRFGEDVNLHFEIKEGEVDCYIEPMLLIPFVENAFKHGIGMVGNPFIKIVLEIKGRRLFFSVINNYNRSNLSKDKSSGIGLDNVKNRLNLLYPGKYELVISDDGGIYSVKLNLEMTC